MKPTRSLAFLLVFALLADPLFGHVAITGGFVAPDRAAPAGARPIYLLQDIHGHAEAQMNIRRVLSELRNDQGDGTFRVGVEGAAGRLDYSAFHRLPDRALAEQIALDFVATGRIGGPELAGVSDPGFEWYGVEEASLYRANVDAYRRAIKRQAAVRLALDQEARELERRKNATFAPPLRQLDRATSRFRSGRLTIGDYLARLRPLSGEAFFAVDTFLSAWAQEKTLDFPAAEAERDRLVRDILERLSWTDALAFKSWGEAALRARDETARLREGLVNWAGRAGLSLRSYPAFDAYRRYAALSDAIDADVLFAETRALEEAAYGALTVGDPAAAALVRASRRHYLATRLTAFALTPAEWTEYADGIQTGSPDYAPFEEFYQRADQRNHSILNEALRRRADAVVVGGFHTAALAAMFRRAGRLPVVIRPKITSVSPSESSSYLNAFAREKTPLERMFFRWTLFLSLPIVLGAEQPLEETGKSNVGEAYALRYAADVDSSLLPQSQPLLARIAGRPEPRPIAARFSAWIRTREAAETGFAVPLAVAFAAKDVLPPLVFLSMVSVAVVLQAVVYPALHRGRFWKRAETSFYFLGFYAGFFALLQLAGLPSLASALIAFPLIPGLHRLNNRALLLHGVLERAWRRLLPEPVLMTIPGDDDLEKAVVKMKPADLKQLGVEMVAALVSELGPNAVNPDDPAYAHFQDRLTRAVWPLFSKQDRLTALLGGLADAWMAQPEPVRRSISVAFFVQSIDPETSNRTTGALVALMQHFYWAQTEEIASPWISTIAALPLTLEEQERATAVYLEHPFAGAISASQDPTRYFGVRWWIRLGALLRESDRVAAEAVARAGVQTLRKNFDAAGGDMTEYQYKVTQLVMIHLWEGRLTGAFDELSQALPTISLERWLRMARLDLEGYQRLIAEAESPLMADVSPAYDGNLAEKAEKMFLEALASPQGGSLRKRVREQLGIQAAIGAAQEEFFEGALSATAGGIVRALQKADLSDVQIVSVVREVCEASFHDAYHGPNGGPITLAFELAERLASAPAADEAFRREIRLAAVQGAWIAARRLSDAEILRTLAGEKDDGWTPLLRLIQFYSTYLTPFEGRLDEAVQHAFAESMIRLSQPEDAKAILQMVRALSISERYTPGITTHFLSRTLETQEAMNLAAGDKEKARIHREAMDAGAHRAVKSLASRFAKFVAGTVTTEAVPVAKFFFDGGTPSKALLREMLSAYAGDDPSEAEWTEIVAREIEWAYRLSAEEGPEARESLSAILDFWLDAVDDSTLSREGRTAIGAGFLEGHRRGARAFYAFQIAEWRKIGNELPLHVAFRSDPAAQASVEEGMLDALREADLSAEEFPLFMEWCLDVDLLKSSSWMDPRFATTIASAAGIFMTLAKEYENEPRGTAIEETLERLFSVEEAATDAFRRWMEGERTAQTTPMPAFWARVTFLRTAVQRLKELSQRVRLSVRAALARIEPTVEELSALCATDLSVAFHGAAQGDYPWEVADEVILAYLGEVERRLDAGDSAGATAIYQGLESAVALASTEGVLHREIAQMLHGRLLDFAEHALERGHASVALRLAEAVRDNALHPVDYELLARIYNLFADITGSLGQGLTALVIGRELALGIVWDELYSEGASRFQWREFLGNVAGVASGFSHMGLSGISRRYVDFIDAVLAEYPQLEPALDKGTRQILLGLRLSLRAQETGEVKDEDLAALKAALADAARPEAYSALQAAALESLFVRIRAGDLAVFDQAMEMIETDSFDASARALYTGEALLSRATAAMGLNDKDGAAQFAQRAINAVEGAGSDAIETLAVESIRFSAHMIRGETNEAEEAGRRLIPEPLPSWSWQRLNEMQAARTGHIFQAVARSVRGDQAGALEAYGRAAGIMAPDYRLGEQVVQCRVFGPWFSCLGPLTDDFFMKTNSEINLSGALTLIRMAELVAPELTAERRKEWGRKQPADIRGFIVGDGRNPFSPVYDFPAQDPLAVSVTSSLDRLRSAAASVVRELKEFKKSRRNANEITSVIAKYELNRRRHHRDITLAYYLGMPDALIEAAKIAAAPAKSKYDVPVKWTVVEDSWPLQAAMKSGRFEPGLRHALDMRSHEIRLEYSADAIIRLAPQIVRLEFKTPAVARQMATGLMDLLKAIRSEAYRESAQQAVARIHLFLGDFDKAQKTLEPLPASQSDWFDETIAIANPGLSLSDRVASYLDIADPASLPAYLVRIRMSESESAIANIVEEVLALTDELDSPLTDMSSQDQRRLPAFLVHAFLRLSPDHPLCLRLTALLDRLDDHVGPLSPAVDFARAVFEARKAGDFLTLSNRLEAGEFEFTTLWIDGWPATIAQLALENPTAETDETLLKGRRVATMERFLQSGATPLSSRYSAIEAVWSMIESRPLMDAFLAVLDEKVAGFDPNDHPVSKETLGLLLSAAAITPGVENLEILDRAVANQKLPASSVKSIAGDTGIQRPLEEASSAADWERRLLALAVYDPDRAESLLARVPESVDVDRVRALIADRREKMDRYLAAKKLLENANRKFGAYDFEGVLQDVVSIDAGDLADLDPSGQLTALYERLTGMYALALQEAWDAYQGPAERRDDEAAAGYLERTRENGNGLPPEAKLMAAQIRTVRSLEEQFESGALGPEGVRTEIRRKLRTEVGDQRLAELEERAVDQERRAIQHFEAARASYQEHLGLLRLVQEERNKGHRTSSSDTLALIETVWDACLAQFEQAARLDGDNSKIFSYLLKEAEALLASGREDMDIGERKKRRNKMRFGPIFGRFHDAQDLAYIVYANARSPELQKRARTIRDMARPLEIYRDLVSHARILSTKLDADIHRANRVNQEAAVQNRRYEPSSVTLRFDRNWTFDGRHLDLEEVFVEREKELDAKERKKRGSNAPATRTIVEARWKPNGLKPEDPKTVHGAPIDIVFAPMMDDPSDYRLTFTSPEGTRHVFNAQFMGAQSGRGLRFTLDESEAEAFSAVERTLAGCAGALNYMEDYVSQQQLNALLPLIRQLRVALEAGDTSPQLDHRLLNRTFGFDITEESSEPRDVTFYNTNLSRDPSQAAMIRDVASPVVSVALVEGPPGAGKTTSEEELIRQWVNDGEIVVLTNQSNAGLDNVGKKLRGRELEENNTDREPVPFIRAAARDHRIDPVLKEFNENRLHLLMECLRNHHKHGKGFVYLATNNGLIFDKKPFALLKMYLDGLPMPEIERWYRRWAKIQGHPDDQPGRRGRSAQEPEPGRRIVASVPLDRVRVILVQEEGSMADVAETVMPILQLNPKKFVILGDPKQLPANGLSADKIDEVMKEARDHGFKPESGTLTEIYSDEALQSQRKSLLERAYVYARRWGGLRTHVLRVLRRGHWALSVFNALFYGNELLHRDHDKDQWEELESDTYVIVDLDQGQKTPVTREIRWDSSWANPEEAGEVVRAVASDLNNGAEPKSIMILSPYTGQNELIHGALFLSAVLNELEAGSTTLKSEDIAKAMAVVNRITNNAEIRKLVHRLSSQGTKNKQAAADVARLRDRLAPIMDIRFKGRRPLRREDVAALVSREEKQALRERHGGKLPADPDPQATAQRLSPQTIDSIQGQERDIVIISFTRSNKEGRIGFLALHDGLKRMNVAISRPRRKIRVIGSFRTLTEGSKRQLGGSSFQKLVNWVSYDFYELYNKKTRRLDTWQERQQSEQEIDEFAQLLYQEEGRKRDLAEIRQELRDEIRVRWSVLKRYPNQPNQMGSLRKAWGSTGLRPLDLAIDLLFGPVLESLPLVLLGHGLLSENAALVILGVVFQFVALPLLHHIRAKARAERDLVRDFRFFAIIGAVYFGVGATLGMAGFSPENAVRLALVSAALWHIRNNVVEALQEAGRVESLDVDTVNGPVIDSVPRDLPPPQPVMGMELRSARRIRRGA